MKLEFRKNFKGYKSIASSFEIPDLKDFNIITGINASGKTHFLQAIKDGEIAVKIDGEIITAEDIQFFNYQSFQLENEKTIESNFFRMEKQYLLSEFMSIGIISNYPNMYNYFENSYNHRYFLFQKILELPDSFRINKFDDETIGRVRRQISKRVWNVSMDFYE